MRASDFIKEGDVVKNKFGLKQQQKNKQQYKYNADIANDIPMYDTVNHRGVLPKHLKNYSKPETVVPFDHFETIEASNTVSHIYGVTESGDYVRLSTAHTILADALVDAYNRGGFTSQDLKTIKLGDELDEADDLDDNLKQELGDYLQRKRDEDYFTSRGQSIHGPGFGMAITGSLLGMTSAGIAGMVPGAILGWIVDLGLWVYVASQNGLDNTGVDTGELRREVKGSNAMLVLPKAIDKLYPMYSKFVMSQLAKNKLISKDSTGNYVYLGKDIYATVELLIDNTFKNEIRKHLDSKEFYDQLRELGFPMQQLYFENEEVFDHPLFQNITNRLRQKVVNDITRFVKHDKTDALKPRIKLKPVAKSSPNTQAAEKPVQTRSDDLPSFSVDPADRPKR